MSGAIKEFAVNVIRPTTIVSKSIELHYHKYALIYPQIRLRKHKIKVEIGDQRDSTLSSFLLEIGERPHAIRPPVDRAIGSGADGTHAELLARFDRDFAKPPRILIGVQPAASQSIVTRGIRIQQSGIQVSDLFELKVLGHDIFHILKRGLKLTVLQSKILTNKITCSITIVLKGTEFREHEQALHDHPLKKGLREAKIEETREAGSDM
jgi:hypothetical protein